MTVKADAALQQAHSLVDRVLAYLGAEGRGPAVEALRAQRDAPRPAAATIVVAGEDKRGKRSLVNALLGQRDMSPVGVKVVTGTPIRFVHAERPSAWLHRYGKAEAQPVDVDTARRLATVEGNPANEENLASITIGLPIEMLRRVNLVDTPGVGGLASGHAALTLQSLLDADALLFLVDATSPIRASELAFLRRASARLQAVVLVVTKTDIHPGWRQILHDDAAILAEQAPRFAGCANAGVSSASYLNTLELDDPEFCAEIRAESGITALEQIVLDELSGSVESVRMQNLMRAAISRLAAVERDLADRRSAALPESEGAEDLQRQVDTLSALRHERRDWQLRLDTEIRKLLIERQDQCARRALEIRHRYEERSRDATIAQLSAMPGEAQAELTALAGELNEFSAKRLAEITSDVLDRLDAEVAVAGRLADIAGAGLRGVEGDFAPRGRRLGHGQRMELLSELGRGRSLLSLASGSSALAFLAPPFGIVVGLGLGGLFAFTSWRAHSRQSQAGDFRVWMQEQVANAQLSIRNGFELSVVDLQNEIKHTVRRVLAEREQSLMASIEAAKALQRSETQARNAQLRKLENQGEKAKTLRLEAAGLLRRLEAIDE